MSIRNIFEQALDYENEASRESFLRDACRGNENLRSQIDSLLAAHAKECRVLDDRVLPAIEARDVSDDFLPPIDAIGPYTIREQIGEGGMGVVFVAEQTKPVQRKVAIKVIKPGMDTKEVIARFEAERQALAFMEHPNIARVLDAGATENGRSYFVMELVRGIPITEYCDQVKATPRERLELFATVCDAVQHAHQKGIIHRDIKPSNVLVTQIGAKPVVKVIDFGLAKAISGQKLTDKTLYTGFMKLMGTPVYMSPEQAGLSSLDADTRSDVYSLGVLLYELLTGSTPLDETEIKQNTYDELCKQIREVEAPKPSARISTLKKAERCTVAEMRRSEPNRLRQMLSGDLDLIVLKALDKDRERRYRSPQEFSADVQRFLDGQPILAVAPSNLYRARKLLWRYRSALSIVAAATVLLIATTAFSVHQARIARQQAFIASEQTAAADSARERETSLKRTAIAEKNNANAARILAEQLQSNAERTSEQRRRELYATDMLLADKLWNAPNSSASEIHDLLVKWIEVDHGKDDLRDFAWRYQWTRLHNAADVTVSDTMAASITRDGTLLIADANGIRQWDNERKAFVSCCDGILPHSNYQILLSPCGRWATFRVGNSMQIVSIQDERRMFTAPGNRARFGTAGELIAVWRRDADGTKADYGLWNIEQEKQVPLFEEIESQLGADGKFELGSIGVSGESIVLHGPQDWLAYTQVRTTPITHRFVRNILCNAQSPDGKLIATGQYGGGVSLYFTESQDPKRSWNLPYRGRGVGALAFSPDSRLLVAGSQEGTLDIWDLSIAFNGDGPNDGAKRVLSLKAHLNSIASIVFSADGQKIVSRTANGVAKLWDLASLFSIQRNGSLPRVDDGDSTISDVARYIQISEVSKGAEDLYNCAIGIRFQQSSEGVLVQDVFEDWNEVVEGGEIEIGDRVIGVANQGHYEEIDASKDQYDVRSMMYGPRNSIVTLDFVSAGTGQKGSVTFRRIHERKAATCDLTFINGGTAVAIADWGVGAVHVTLGDLTTKRYPARGSSVVSSPDGKRMALDDFRQLVIWDLQKQEPAARWDARVSSDSASFVDWRGSLAFSQDCKYIAMGTGYRFLGSAKRSDLLVWDLATRKLVTRQPLWKCETVISAVAFTPDNKWLLAAAHDGELRIYDTATWKCEEIERALHRPGRSNVALALDPDGKNLVLSGSEGVILFDIESGKVKRRHIRHGISFAAQVFSQDGRTLAGTLGDGSVVLLDPVSGMSLAKLIGHETQVTAVAFSPDNHTLASIDIHGGLRLWEARSMEEIDHDRLIVAAMQKRARLLTEDGKFRQAEDALRLALRIEESKMSADSTNRMRIRKGLARALTARGILPHISQQPTSERVEIGDGVTLSVSISNRGNRDVEYQWYFGDDPIRNANEATYVLPSVSSSQLGRYHVEIGFTDPRLAFVTLKSDGAFVVGPDRVAKGGLRSNQFLYTVDANASRPLETLTDLYQRSNSAAKATTLGSFELPPDWQDTGIDGQGKVGARISGFVVPPKTGNYVFHLVSRNRSQLSLSTDDSPTNKTVIANSFEKWLPERGWQRTSPENTSAAIPLQAGRRYWIEAICLAGGHCSVTWELPDEPPPKNGDLPIDGKFLEHRLE